MKMIRQWGIIVLVLAGMLLSQGCALLLVGGAIAGATYGTVKYARNTLQVTQDVPLDRAWRGANAALKKLQMPVTASSHDGTSGRLVAQNAQNQSVTIQLFRKTDSVTEIQITVGTFDSDQNRSQEQLIYDTMKARF